MQSKKSLSSHYHKLYLSYSWTENQYYHELESLLRMERFEFSLSILSSQHPIHETPDERKLYEAIENKIKFNDAAILLCGAYAPYSRWINKEIIACKEELNKPLVAIQRSEGESIPLIIKENADFIVGWNAEDIVNCLTIRK